MWLNRLEYKFGRYRIRNLSRYLVIGQVILFLVYTALPRFFYLNMYFPLVRSDLARGKIWELVTVLFTPATYSPINFLLSAYFLYFIGQALEQVWGDFRFNVFILLSWLAAVISCLITGVGTMGYLPVVLFIAFALYYPDQRLLLFFVIPIPARYLGLGAGLMLVYYLLRDPFYGKINLLLACAVLFVFFGKGLVQHIRDEINNYKRRQAWKNANSRWQ